MLAEQFLRRKKALALLISAGGEVKREFGKSLLRQLIELGVVGFKGYSAADYYVLGLYESHQSAHEYMNRGQFDEVRRKWNPPVRGIIEFNKWVFYNYCIGIGIPTPVCYGIFHSQIGITADGRPLRLFNQLTDLMASIGKPVVIKPIAGAHGDLVTVIDRFEPTKGIIVRANEQELSIEKLQQLLMTEHTPWLLQAKVRQHKTLLALHGSSLNTSRIITLLDSDGEVHVLGAVLRIGVGTAEIDNTTGGGISAAIDLTSGICGPAVSETTIKKFSQHPDTGCQIEGLELPGWHAAVQTTTRAHRLLPFARSLGWDVAFSEEGPVIIEVNGTWHYNHIQMTGKSLWNTPFGLGPKPSAQPT